MALYRTRRLDVVCVAEALVGFWLPGINYSRFVVYIAPS